MGDVFAAIIGLLAGLFIDATFKLLSLKVEWGFSYDKNPLLCFFAGSSLLMIPVGIANGFALSTYPWFIGLFLFFALILYISYYEKPANEVPYIEDNAILDDEI